MFDTCILEYTFPYASLQLVSFKTRYSVGSRILCVIRVWYRVGNRAAHAASPLFTYTHNIQHTTETLITITLNIHCIFFK